MVAALPKRSSVWTPRRLTVSVDLVILFRDSSGLKQLISLYVGRTGELWKDKAVIGWLERNVRSLVNRLPKAKGACHTTLEEFRQM